MSESKHTPLPWRVFTTPDGRLLVGIGAEDGGGICDAGFGIWAWNDEEGIANANLVVRAVNSHDNLLAELKTSPCPRPMNGSPQDLTAEDCLARGECGCSVGLAIAKATGAAVPSHSCVEGTK